MKARCFTITNNMLKEEDEFKSLYYIKLSNDIYDDLSISNEELTILSLMYRNYMQYKGLAVCSIQMLADYMNYDSKNNHKIISRIKDIISELIENKYITKIYNLTYREVDLFDINKDIMFYVELPTPPDTLYFKVFDKNIDTIFDYLKDKKLNKFSIIRYYIACCRVSNNDSSIGYLTQGKLNKLVSDSRTIQRYNKILQDELQLIIYNNSYLTPDKHYCTTFIGKYDDEENFNRQLEVEVSSKELVHTDKIKSNKKRSIKQEINNMESEADKDRARIKELEEKLKQYEELQYKEKIKEENVFVESEPKHKGLGKKNKPKEAVNDDSDFLEEMGWDKEIQEENDEFIDWDEE